VLLYVPNMRIYSFHIMSVNLLIFELNSESICALYCVTKR
jgi:hypothetical protein